MLGLVVYLNRRKLTVAGAEDLGVLHAMVTAGGKLGKSTLPFGERQRSVDVHLSVGGLTRRAGGVEDEHLRWVKLRRLRVGDRISVQIVRTDRPDKQVEATPAVRETRQTLDARRRRLEKGMKKGSAQ